VRALSLATRQALMAEETGEVFLFILTLSHPSMPTMYFVNNPVPIVSNGEVYTPYHFDLALPDDTVDEIPRIQLMIDNIDQRVVQAVRSIDTPAEFTLTLIRAAEPNVAVAGPFSCTLRNVSYTSLTVSGDLWPYEDVMSERFPQHDYTPANFRGLFA